jgi:DNA-binding transcriptional LysR family regulator
MTLEQLRIFAAVAEHQHVTRAAKFLNMTQSAVSAAVLALERRHGVALFDRVGRSIILNQTGRVFLERAQRVLVEARAAEAALDDLAGLSRGELCVMASLTIAAYWLPRHLAVFHSRYPGIKFDISIGNTEAVANAAEAGLVEIGLVEGKVDRAALSSSAVATDEMVIVAAPDHSLAGVRRLTGAHLQEAAWVLREPGSGTRLAFEAMATDMHLKTNCLDVVMTLPSNEAVLGTVEAGLGLTLTSRSAAKAELAAKSLVELALPPRLRPFFLLRHKERFRSKVGNAFEKLLRSEAA